MNKFITFTDKFGYDNPGRHRYFMSAETQVNNWLESNPNIKIISWTACDRAEDKLTIVVQYLID